MLGLRIGIQFDEGGSSGAGLPQYIKNFIDRVLADGGVIESPNCIESGLELVSNPIITLLGDNPALSVVGENYNDSGATAYDDVLYGNLTYEMRTSTDVDINQIGFYEVKYNLTDPSGNTATEVVRKVYIISKLADRFKDRVLADGGVVESLQCVDNITYSNYDWSFYFRVTDDGGVVESLECLN